MHKWSSPNSSSFIFWLSSVLPDPRSWQIPVPFPELGSNEWGCTRTFAEFVSMYHFIGFFGPSTSMLTMPQDSRSALSTFSRIWKRFLKSFPLVSKMSALRFLDQGAYQLFPRTFHDGVPSPLFWAFTMDKINSSLVPELLGKKIFITCALGISSPRHATSFALPAYQSWNLILSQ